MSKVEELIKQYCPDGIEYISLGYVCDVYTGGEPPIDCIKTDVPDHEHPYAVWGNGKEIYGYSSTYRIDRDAVVISSIGANTGAVYYRKAYFTPIIRLKVIIPKTKDLDVRFLFYALSSIRIKSKNSSVPNMNASEIKEIVIPVPPLPIQEEIVRILDKYTELEQELEQNLEQELELRKKQYEYYRDKMLSLSRITMEK